MARQDSKRPQEPKQPRMDFAGLQKEDMYPSVHIVALNRDQKPIHTSEIKEDGSFDLPEKVLKSAYRIVIGAIPDDEDEAIDTENSLFYRPEQFADLMARGDIGIAERYWRRWYFFTTCVAGSVQKCTFLPWWWQALPHTLASPLANNLDFQPVQTLSRNTLRDVIRSREVNRVAFPELEILDVFPIYRCETVCIGTVEVYQRRCCCEWVIDLGWLEDLLRELEDLVRVIPDDIPIPDPVPDPFDPSLPPRLMKSVLFEGGTLNQKALNAKQDLYALNTLPMEQLEDYIFARPYLRRCSCSHPHKVAEGTINPDGTFNICWRTFPVLFDEDCHNEYAYIVKQEVDGETIVIYNGLAANQWFHANDDAVLKSTDARAIGCPDPDQRVNDAAVYLDTIGGTESWHLATPLSDSWDGVQPAVYNSGLAFPAPTDADAAGQFKNCNWGGTLNLRYMFTWQLKQLPEKPTYYRVSWISADDNGNPTAGATRHYFSQGLAWKKYENLKAVPVTLGPNTVGSEDNLYTIPYYDGTVNWTGSTTRHASINTHDFPDGRYIITLELFDETGQRLHPFGTTPVSAGDQASDFHFLRWFQDTPGPDDDFVNIPYGALSHMVWWDNRPVKLELGPVYLNGVEFNQECLFLNGEPTSTVALAYRAYHPNARFLYNHGLSWRRGYGSYTGSTGNFPKATPDALGAPLMVHGNVGTEPLFPFGISGTRTFEQMLRTDLVPTRQKCTFAVSVAARAKTTNGSGFADWTSKGGSFALDMTDPCAGCEDCD